MCQCGKSLAEGEGLLHITCSHARSKLLCVALLIEPEGSNLFLHKKKNARI